MKSLWDWGRTLVYFRPSQWAKSSSYISRPLPPWIGDQTHAIKEFTSGRITSMTGPLLRVERAEIAQNMDSSVNLKSRFISWRGVDIYSLFAALLWSSLALTFLWGPWKHTFFSYYGIVSVTVISSMSQGSHWLNWDQMNSIIGAPFWTSPWKSMGSIWSGCTIHLLYPFNPAASSCFTYNRRPCMDLYLGNHAQFCYNVTLKKKVYSISGINSLTSKVI